MKIIIAMLLMLSVGSTAYAEVKVYTGEPECRYEVVSPVEGRNTNPEKAYKKMLKAADKLGADAIIQLKTGGAVVGVPTPYGSTLMGTVTTVGGIAVKCLQK